MAREKLKVESRVVVVSGPWTFAINRRGTVKGIVANRIYKVHLDGDLESLTYGLYREHLKEIN